MKFLALLLSIVLYLLPANVAYAFQNNLRKDDLALVYYDRLMFQSVVELYEGDIKKRAISPYALIMLCSALNELGSDVQNYFAKQNAEVHVTQFALAYNDLLKGKSEKAKKRFHQLCSISETGQYLGIIGLVESALFLLDHNALKEYLKEASSKNLSSGKKLEEIILNYSIIYNNLIGNMNKVLELQKKYDQKNFDKDVELLLIEIEVKIAQNRIDDALKSVNDIISIFGPLQNAVLLKHRLIDLKNGPIASNSFLEKMIGNNKNLWQLRLTKYFQILEESEGVERFDIVEKIVEIAKNRKKDFQTLLMICNGLFDHGYPVDAGKLMNIFFEKADNQSNFFLSNYYMSKFHYYTDEKIRFNVSLKNAKKQSPRNFSFLWFQYFLAINAGDSSEALKVLAKIESFDPFDTIVLYENIIQNANLNRWDQVVLNANKLLESKRFIGLKMKEKIISKRDQAKSHLQY